MNKFAVLGLPRSRTYWLSKFLNCEHEALYYYPDYTEYLKTNSPGDSTTCFLQIKDHIKNWPKIIISRNIDDVAASMEAIGIPADMLFLNQLKHELIMTDGLHIPFNNIDKNLRNIWEYVYDDPYDEERGQALCETVLNNDEIIVASRNIIG